MKYSPPQEFKKKNKIPGRYQVFYTVPVVVNKGNDPSTQDVYLVNRKSDSA